LVPHNDAQHTRRVTHPQLRWATNTSLGFSPNPKPSLPFLLVNVGSTKVRTTLLDNEYARVTHSFNQRLEAAYHLTLVLDFWSARVRSVCACDVYFPDRTVYLLDVSDFSAHRHLAIFVAGRLCWTHARNHTGSMCACHCCVMGTPKLLDTQSTSRHAWTRPARTRSSCW